LGSETPSKPDPARPRWNDIYSKKGVELGVESGDFIVALDEEKVFALAPVVYYIWSKCDGETTIGSIVKDLMDYVEDADEDTVYNAVVDVVDELVQAGLLEKSP